MPSQLQLYPVKLKWKLEYKSHYIYDIIRKDHVIWALTWLEEHNDHYRKIEINKNWCSIVSDDGLSQILIQDGDPDANFVKGHNIQEESTPSRMGDPDVNFVKGHNIQEESTPSRMANANTSQEEVMQQFYTFNTNDLTTQTHNAIISKIIIMTILQNLTRSLLKIRLLSTKGKY